MNICILGDTHFGARNDLSLFHDQFKKFYDWMIPQLVEQKITDIFQLGDLWDRRKYINFHTLAQARKYFFDPLASHGIRLHTLVGNHDIYWRESLSVNSSSLVLRDYDNVVVYDRPQTVTIDNTTIDIIPWICADNEDEVKQFISKSTSDLCFGHFEIETFAMYRGMESHDGLPVDTFAKYELVCSGHFHTRSSNHNITYVGTPCEMTWQDYNDPKGFHIFSTKTRKLSFVESPFHSFIRLEYDDKNDMVDIDSVDLTNCFVKVVVTNKTNAYKFDQFIQTLHNKQPYDLKIIEDMSEFSDGEIGDDINLEDTIDVLSNYVDSIDTDADKEQIKMFMKNLYIEAVNVDVVE